MTSGATIARKAFENLASSVSAADQAEFRNTTVAEVWLEIHKIENEQRGRRDLRFMRRIQPLVQTIDAYSSTLDTLCQGYPPMSWVWGPIKLILSLAKNFENVIDTVLEAFNDIAENLPRIDRLKTTFPNDENFNRVVAYIYSDLLEFHGRAYKMFRRRAWHYWFAFDWGLFQRRFKSVLHNLSKHCEILDKEAAAIHFAESRDERDRRKLQDDAYERQTRLKMASDVVTWLSESEGSQEDYLHELADQRQPETCNWILQDPQMGAWMDESSSRDFLWMTGIPGAGKTFVASLLIENLQSRGDRCWGYCFCGQVTTAGNVCVEIMRTLTVQLLQQNPDMAPLIHEGFLQRLSSRSVASIKKMLICLLPEVKKTFLVIDGIDELGRSEQETILKALGDIAKETDNDCKFLILSRDEPQIRKFLSKNHLKLEGKTDESIRQYIANNVESLRLRHPDIDAVLGDRIKDRLHTNAKGMFLWVRLVIRMLDEKGSVSEIEASIDDLPDGLDRAYGRILDRIKTQLSPYLRARAYRIFYWLCTARRTVSMHEVVDGIAINFKQRELTNGKRVQNIKQDVIELCAPLLEKTSHDALQLVHFTAREFLLDFRSGPFAEESQAQYDVATSCIVNMISAMELIPNFSSFSEHELEKRVVEGRYGLCSYASEFWTHHFLLYMATRKDGNKEDSDLAQALKQLSGIIKHSFHDSTERPYFDSDKLLYGFHQLDVGSLSSRLVVSCALIPQKIDEAKSAGETRKIQEDRLKLLDHTRLSQIRCRLREISERILEMDPTNLPAHIPRDHYQTFIARNSYRCRYIDCTQTFESCERRQLHEPSHVAFFPCPDCDISSRGFASRRDLEKHIKAYHSETTDFETLLSTQCEQGIQIAKDSSYQGRKPAQRWNARGRRTLQTGFEQILSSIDLAVKSIIAERGGVASLEEKARGSKVNELKQNIKHQQYDSLEDFKADVRKSLTGVPFDGNLTEEKLIEVACERGLKQAFTASPTLGLPDIMLFQSSDHQLSSIDRREEAPSVSTDPNKAASIPRDRSATQAKFYWSQIDIDNFPVLLQRFGKDFDAIARTLGTKSSEEVGRFYQQLVGEGRSDLQSLAESIHTSPAKKESEKVEISENKAMELPVFSTDRTYGINGPSFEFSQSLGLSEPNQTESTPQASSNDENSLLGEDNQLPGNKVTERERKKRRPPTRMYCPDCQHDRHGFYDEYALQKHINRLHEPIRKVWKCHDISADRSFLRDCEKCSSGKKYNAKVDASRHLRLTHFNRKTPFQTLSRWIWEFEEQNPKYKGPANADSSIENPGRKRQKTGETAFSLPPIVSSRDEQGLLPSIESIAEMGSGDQLRSHDGTKTPKPSTAVASMTIPPMKLAESGTEPDSDSDSDERSESDDENTTIFNHVSFDNLLGMGSSAARTPEPDTRSHRSNKTLIQPEHVAFLPHLDVAMRVIYKDQIEALHSRLDDEAPLPGARSYPDLKKLENLSRRIRRDLKNWRAQQARAPPLPFSI